MFDDSTVKLTVKDNGQGFPAGLLASAFDPYVTTKAHGTGLGLAIVKKMIEEHDGQIKIENNPQENNSRENNQNGGACITIVLPLEKAIQKENAVENELTSQKVKEKAVNVAKNSKGTRAA